MSKPCVFEKVQNLLQELALHTQGTQQLKHVISLSEEKDNFQLSPFCP